LIFELNLPRTKSEVKNNLLNNSGGFSIILESPKKTKHLKP
jgi:hypothetical protein